MKYVVITRGQDGRIDAAGRNIVDLSLCNHAQLSAFATFMNKELARSQSTRHPKNSTFTPMEEAERLKIVDSKFMTHDSVWKLFNRIGYCARTEVYE